MAHTYMSFICDKLNRTKTGVPVYSAVLAKELAREFGLNPKAAAAAVAVTLKRVMDNRLIPELRAYQKGIYYRTAATPFGELGINREQLIADKYLAPDIGYETGPGALHRMGLTTQMPKERVLATNAAHDCLRVDKRLGVMIRPPKIRVTAENKYYLQILDALDMLEHSPVDAERPYEILAEHIRKLDLQYEALLALADSHYSQNTVLRLAHTASAGGAAV